MDFSKLLSTLSEEVKRKPNQKPVGMALPSEMAIGEIQQGAEEAIPQSALTQEVDQGKPLAGSPFELADSEQSATRQGIADEPSNADNIYAGQVNPTVVDTEAQQMGAMRPDNTALISEKPLQKNRRDALADDIDLAQTEYQAATQAPVQKQSFWKDFGAKLIQGADAFFNGNRAPIVGWGKLKHDYAVKEAEGKLNPLLAMQKQQQDTDLRQAQIDTIPIDDQNRRDQIANQKQIADERIKSQAQAKLYGSKIFDVKNPAHRAMAKSAGLNPDTMASWDFNNAEKVTINGEVFTRDRTTGEYTPAKGLPASEKDKIVAIDVAVPGEKNLDGSQKIRKFNVPQSQAATMSNSLQQAGLQIEAAEKRQISQQNFQGQQNEADRVIRQEQFIANYALKVADDARQAMDRANAAGATAQSKADAKAQWKVTEINKIKAALAEKKLDEETANQMINAVENQ